MRKVMFALAIVAMTMTSASAQSSGPGGHASAFGGGFTARRVPQVNSHGACDSLCQTKCQGAWRALGFRSVNACVVRWAKLNAEGTAAACETAIKANGMRPIRGC